VPWPVSLSPAARPASPDDGDAVARLQEINAVRASDRRTSTEIGAWPGRPIAEIGEGTSEVQRLLIARELGLPS
jgi:hypothetical protein